MRIAIVSDIHGNRTAFEAVLEDLRQTSPDMVLHGGDLADVGASPAEIVGRIRELGWPGVSGNTDEMLWRPESLEEFATRSPELEAIWTAVRERAAATREALGAERLAWLQKLPRLQMWDRVALVHASPDSLWLAPGPEVEDADLESVCGRLGHSTVVYGHIHRPFIRRVRGLKVANSGSAGLPYDGDRRAAYVMVNGPAVSIRRVEYDVEREVKALFEGHFPHAGWVANMLRSASPQMP